MIKGCNKRVIVVKDTGSAVIEEAFFILKPGSETGNVSSDNILKHANTILGKSAYNSRFSDMNMNVSSKQAGQKSSGGFWFGVLLGAAVTMLLTIIF